MTQRFQKRWVSAGPLAAAEGSGHARVQVALLRRCNPLCSDWQSLQQNILHIDPWPEGYMKSRCFQATWYGRWVVSPATWVQFPGQTEVLYLWSLHVSTHLFWSKNVHFEAEWCPQVWEWWWMEGVCPWMDWWPVPVEDALADRCNTVTDG